MATVYVVQLTLIGYMLHMSAKKAILLMCRLGAICLSFEIMGVRGARVGKLASFGSSGVRPYYFADYVS